MQNSNVELFPLGRWQPRIWWQQKVSIWGKMVLVFSLLLLCWFLPPPCSPPVSDLYRVWGSQESSELTGSVICWLQAFESGRGLKSMLPFMNILWILQRALLPLKRKHRLFNMQLSCPGWIQLISTGTWPKIFIGPRNATRPSSPLSSVWPSVDLWDRTKVDRCELSLVLWPILGTQVMSVLSLPGSVSDIQFQPDPILHTNKAVG